MTTLDVAVVGAGYKVLEKRPGVEVLFFSVGSEEPGEIGDEDAAADTTALHIQEKS